MILGTNSDLEMLALALALYLIPLGRRFHVFTVHLHGEPS